MSLEKCLIYLNIIHKSIKKFKLSPFDYYILYNLIETHKNSEDYVYTQKFVNILSNQTGIGKTKIITSLKKLDQMNFIDKKRASHDERCTYLSIDKQQYELFDKVKSTVNKQINILQRI